MRRKTGDVVVSRSALRGMRSLVAGVGAALVVLVVALGLMAVGGQERCEAGNEFRRRDLPAAFEVHDRHLARAMGATPEQLASFEAEFQTDLDELFPERACPLLP